MPGSITGAALTALIMHCGGPTPPTDLMTRIVMHESGGDPGVTHLNKNGTTDYGLAQINSSNLVWLGETPVSVMDPCHNIAAEVRILRSLSVYATGSPEKGFVLTPPGQSISYVESMADPRFRMSADAGPVSAPLPPPRKHTAQLFTIATRR